MTTTRAAVATQSTFDPTQPVAVISWVTTQKDKIANSGDKNFIQTRSSTRRKLVICTLGQDFAAYRPAGSRRLSPEAWIRQCLMKPITQQDTERGFIYMYWPIGNFGLVKIGNAFIFNSLVPSSSSSSSSSSIVHSFLYPQLTSLAGAITAPVEPAPPTHTGLFVSSRGY
jgi:hypothetical protein